MQPLGISGVRRKLALCRFETEKGYYCNTQSATFSGLPQNSCKGSEIWRLFDATGGENFTSNGLCCAEKLPVRKDQVKNWKSVRKREPQALL